MGNHDLKDFSFGMSPLSANAGTDIDVASTLLLLLLRL